MKSTINFVKPSKIDRADVKQIGIVCALIFSVLGTGCGESKDAALASKKLPEQQASKAWQEVLQLDPKAIALESGFAFTYQAPQIAGAADIAGQESRSPFGLMEDGKLLTPSHAIHDDIRKNGKGRWSHWGGAIYFSSSDGSDPRQNNRKYVLVK